MAFGLHTTGRLTNDVVNILGAVSLSEEQRQVLSRGERFIIRRATASHVHQHSLRILEGVDAFRRRVQLAEYFRHAQATAGRAPLSITDTSTWLPKVLPSNSAWMPPFNSTLVMSAMRQLRDSVAQRITSVTQELALSRQQSNLPPTPVSDCIRLYKTV